MRQKINSPFFVINPKNLLYGGDLLELAKNADTFAEQYDVQVFFTAPPLDLANIAKYCSHIKVTAQHMDEMSQGHTMGKVIASSLSDIGVQAVVLNHADHPLSVGNLLETVRKAKEVDIKTIICSNSILEAKIAAMIEPDIVLAEPTALIGKKQISSRDYVQTTIETIKRINSNVLVEQGAGVRSKEDVKELLELGADGVGVTSGILKAKNPINMMENMIKTVANFREKGEQ